VVARWLEIGVPFRVLPPVSQVLKEEALLVQLRAIEPEDLMIRAPAMLDKHLIEGVVSGKRVLITGAVGSVGSELVKQIAAYPNGTVICVEHAENPLLMLKKQLRAQHPDTRIVTLIGDIADPAQMGPIFRDHKPDIVFHAAAFKHVPFMENAPARALRNNVCGTITVSRCAMAAEVEQFILVSTDKAVKPSSVMGATKRVAELLVRSFNDATPTRFTIVRSGNVLGSSGSVVPIFKDQIEHGGPLTVTDRQDPRPSRDHDYPSGHRPHIDMDILSTGLMPGEKLHEQLAEPYETFSGTAHPKLFYSEGTLAQSGFLERALELLSTLNEAEGAPQIRLRIADLLPEYSPV
jgi:FlaA1/EpsC-like NDP-sugar epimerase